MILGNGDIALALKELPLQGALGDKLFFASGVSNSRETRKAEYKREEDLLLKQNKNKHLVYFSSLACFYNPNTRYARHKKHMENLVKTYFKRFTIIRMGNITWGTNPHTLLNYFKNAAKKGDKIEIQDTYRYIVEKAEFLHWIHLIPDWNCEMNITGQRLKVKQIVKKYVR